MPINSFAASTISEKQVFLKRLHINHRLEEAIQKPVTTVVAGAGYGKTHTVISFLQGNNIDHIWLPLTILDNNISKHWENAKNILSTRNPQFAEIYDALGFPDTPGKMVSFVFLLSDALTADKKCVLVYDDFHLITDERMLRYIERIVNACIPNLSIILISRKEPDINTASLLSKGLLATMDEEDFRFSESEMTSYFQINNLNPSPHILSKIYEQTSGWILAIYLIGLSLKKGAANEEYALTAMRVNIFKLMESEIYSVASEDFQHFLVKLSLFDNLPLELLEVLCGGNHSLINKLSSVTSFIRYDSLVNIYYIHHLFLEFLSGKQSLLTEEEKTGCYLQAAEWCEKNNYRLDAIENYAKAKEYLKMIYDITNHPTYVSFELAQYFVQIYDMYLDEMGDLKYLAMVCRTRYTTYSQTNEEVLVDFTKLEKMIQSFPDSPNKDYLLCLIYLIWGFTDLYRYKNTFKETLQKAYDLGCDNILMKYKFALLSYACVVNTPEVGVFERFLKDIDEIIPCINTITNGAGYGNDDLCKAEFTFFRRDSKQALMNSAGYGYSDLCKAEFAFFRRDLKQAEKYAYQAIVNAQKNDQHYIEDMALFYLMRMNISLGNYEEILNVLEKLKLQIEKYQHSSYYTMHVIASGWFYSLIGQMDRVALWNDKNRMNLAQTASIDTAGWCQLLIARCLLTEKKYSEALALLGGLVDAPRNDQLLQQIETTVLKAVALHQLKEKDEAIEMLQKAYELSHTNALIMPFIEQGNNMLTLVKAAIKSKSCKIPYDWLENIQKKSSAYAKKVSFLASEYIKLNGLGYEGIKRLTKKELECLKDMCQGLSRVEIASTRNLSENSVKLQIQNVYNKLGAKNSKEAVRIAYTAKII